MSSRNSIVNNSVTSGRDIDSILNGTRAFVWSRELIRSDQPYIDHKYHIPFNPPPNEVNFIGGLGSNRGHRRSKVHPNRPTMVQQIYRMRTHNCIDVTLTQPLAQTNNCVQKKSKQQKSVRDIVQQISLADIGESNSVDSIESDVSENVLLAQKVREKIARNSEDVSEAYSIDGVPFRVQQRQVRSQIDEIVRNFAVQASVDAKTNGVMSDERGTFRQWLSETLETQKCAEPSTKDLKVVDDEDRNSELSSARSSIGRARNKSKKPKRRRGRNALNHLMGYMNGPFMRQKPKTSSDDRFGIPFTMIDRGRKEHEKRDIQANVLRRVRLSHMGYRQPPSKEDSSDNESVQNVKRLALLRTPYFLMPIVRISQVRKKERIRNKFLRKDRLNRINLLLFDRTRKLMDSKGQRDVDDGSDAGDDDDGTIQVTKKHEYFAKFFQLRPKKTAKRVHNPTKTKYYKIIADKFQEHRMKCESDEMKQRLSFDEFKQQQNSQEIDTVKVDDSTPAANGKIDAVTVPNQSKCDETVGLAEKLFESACRTKTKLRQTEPIDGPLYIDPHLNVKVSNPRKFIGRSKYYTNLFKSKLGLRNRLHVNGEHFEHGKLNVVHDENFPRWPTEWDDYYVHEMRYRRPAPKFCVKTDILKLRDMVRRNFLMFYAQENLFDLKARLMAENRLMDEVEFFAKECDKLFDGWCDEAYAKVFEKNERLDAIHAENATLAIERNELFEKCDKLSKEILLSENRWNFLLKIQNYYYLLMEASWREENDWIHRDKENNRLLQPLEAIKACPRRNLRTKSECSANAVRVYFEREIEPKLDQIKSIEPDAKVMSKNLAVLWRKSFVSLEQYNKTVFLHRDIEEMHEKMTKDMLAFENLQRERINVFQRRLEFASERCRRLEAYNERIQFEVAIAVKNPVKRKVMHCIEPIYDRFAPVDRRKAALIDKTTQMEKFEFVHWHCMELLRKLDRIPIDVLIDCEKNVRERRRLDDERAKDAIVAQKRSDMFAKQLKQRFMPAAVFRRVQIPTIVQKRIQAARRARDAEKVQKNEAK